MDEVTLAVVGAGVVGLAVAADLAARHEGVVVLERHDSFGRETSSRNSEVIHAGMYYPAGSLKAELCVEGRRELYHFCRQNDVPHRMIGKVIVAADESEIPVLEELVAKGAANGVEELAMIDRAGLSRLEPRARGVAALHSPVTGIIDSHTLMKKLAAIIEARGAILSFGSEVTRLERTPEGWVMTLTDGYQFRSRMVVNSAGLSSDRVAGMAGIDLDRAGYRLRYCKGSYFSYAGPSPVGRLVYPVPHQDLAGLGVHATLDLAGRLRFGPDTEYVAAIDYAVDGSKAPVFSAGAMKIIDGLDAGLLQPDMAGVRPKLDGPGVRDFVIAHETDRDLGGLVNLVGIESPGLTACLAIARRVGRLADDYLN